jgi:hypothetical protein
MRITVEIEDSKIKAIQKWTKMRKKSPAVARALDEFIEQRQRQEFREKVEQGNTQKHGKSWKEVEKCNLTPFDIQQIHQSEEMTFTKPLYQRMLEDLRVEPQ